MTRSRKSRNICNSICGSIGKSKTNREVFYILDSGASLHIYSTNIFTNSMTRSSRFKIKDVGGTVLQATEQGMCRNFGNYLIVPNATANLISISRSIAIKPY
jgi:hypothetical protein